MLLLTPLQRWAQSYWEGLISAILTHAGSCDSTPARQQWQWLTCWLPPARPPARGRSPGASWGSPLAWLSTSRGARCAAPARCNSGARPPRRHSPPTSLWGAPWSSGGFSPPSKLLVFWNTRKASAAGLALTCSFPASQELWGTAFRQSCTAKSSGSFAVPGFSQIHPLVEYLLPVEHTSLANSLFLRAAYGTRKVCKAVGTAPVEDNTTVKQY